ncbi:hypothetical protein PVBG_06145 [Plasmodium vivax Brazil I]|uniref:Fam-l protein n=1 Tax=Plasmodium vivax (strain Brazil I) TaxID=1033975 RepID=A0A0J9VB14_PLAV1|nr:hypothetical protein PVBG_06145 [Plasmodium vivax Brazil I]
MSVQKNPYMSHILKIPFFTNILIFVLLSWIYQYNYNTCTIVKSLEYRSRIDTCLGRNTNRLLAKHRDESELQRIRLQNKANNNAHKYKLANGNESNNTYEHLKHDNLNNVDIYLRSYKSRYSKKKGLKKIDCYYEKKLFSTINKLEKHKGKNNSSKNRIKRVLLTKYGLPYIILSLLPILLLVVPLREIPSKVKYTPSGSFSLKKDNAIVKTPFINFNIDDTTLPCILFYISITIFFSLAIYTYIKILKYQRIKAGMLK